MAVFQSSPNRRAVGGCVAVALLTLVVWVAAPPAAADVVTDTTEADFLAGTLTGVAATAGGDVVLAPGPGRPAKQGVVLDLGPPGAYDSVRAFQPFVLRETDGSYKMWYTGWDGAGGTNRFRMMFADSPDGLSWTKRGVVIDVLTPPYSFDSVNAMSVIKEGSTYHMWFCGGFWTGGPIGGGVWGQNYHATSSDGMSWTIQGVALGLGTSGAWDSGVVNTPSVLRDALGVYWMSYAGWGGVTTQIGLATSTTYTGFIRFAGNPTVPPGSSGAWDDYATTSPSVVRGSSWTMYYAGGDGTNYNVGAAASSDGYTWMKDPSNPFLTRGPSGWDSWGIASAAYVWDPAAPRLYYAGTPDGTVFRIGLATLTPNYVSAGTFRSRVFDGGAGATWQTIAWNADAPAGTSIAMSVRGGDTPVPDGTWTAWSPVTNPAGSAISLPRSRYLQYAANLATSTDTVSPSLHDVTITYARNVGPTATPTDPTGGEWVGTNGPTLRWSTVDLEGDAQVTYEVEASQDPGFASPFASGILFGAAQAWQPGFLVEGPWYWRVRAGDRFGAWGGWSSTSFGVDVTPPATIASLAGSPGLGGWYTGPVTVSLAATDPLSGVASTRYRVDGGGWQAYAAPFVVPGDGVHWVDFYSSDAAGNVEPARYTTFRIDSTPPTTVAFLSGPLGSSGWYTGAVSVTLVASDALNGVAGTEYRLDGGAWQTYTNPFAVSGEGTHFVEFRSTDGAGLMEGIQSSVVRIDSVPAQVTPAFAGQLGGGGWYISDVTVSLSATDATSGVAEIHFRVDSGIWQAYVNPFSVSGDGMHAVQYYATDVAGSDGAVDANAFRIDTTPPTSAAFLSGLSDGGGWYRSTVTVTLTASDDSSGVAGTEYRLDGGAWHQYLVPVLVSGDGSHTVEFRSTDVASLVEPIRSAVFAVDTTPPSTVATLAGEAGDHGWHVGPVTVTLAGADASSGIATTEYRLDGGSWQPYGAPITATTDGTHIVEFRSTDVAGLTEAPGTVAFGIDTTAPETTASLFGQRPGDRFTTLVVVELVATDETSGVSLTEYRVDGGPWQSYAGAFRIATDGTHVVEFRSTDTAGIEEGPGSVSFRIDTSLVSPSGPVGPWLLVFLIAVIAGFAVLIFLLVRKQRRREVEPTTEKED